MLKPYTIRLFMPEGNPNTFKIIDKMNWTGIGLEVSREAWKTHRDRTEFAQAGIYILFGYQDGEDLPSVYIGQGDGIRSRIDSHEKAKSFWHKALVFVSSNNGLNRAHITWLEWALIHQAKKMKRCALDNSVTPNEPILTESEKADTQEFLDEILSILPLVEIRVFEKAEKIEVLSSPSNSESLTQDTIIVPAQEEGFKAVFIGENSWYAVRIAGGRLKDIKYIAAYQTAPISAVTHYAEVQSIERYGDGEKYKLNFKGSAKKIPEIKFGKAKRGSMQGIRYTNLNKLLNAKEIIDI